MEVSLLELPCLSGSDRGGNLSVRLGAGSCLLERRVFILGEFRADIGKDCAG